MESYSSLPITPATLHKFLFSKIFTQTHVWILLCVNCNFITLNSMFMDQSFGLFFHLKKWIFIKRQKTDVSSRIPLLPPALEIINSFEQHPQCKSKDPVLPVLSNQKMNSYLKEIADACGINKKLTYHIARHTFATTITLSNGVPIETVSKMLGHRNIKTTQHYAKILDNKISEDMRGLRLKFSSSE